MGLEGALTVVPQCLLRSLAEEALAATGTASIRRRRLPAEQVVWLVIGVALMRNESMECLAAWLQVGAVTAPADSRPRRAACHWRRRHPRRATSM